MRLTFCSELGKAPFPRTHPGSGRESCLPNVQFSRSTACWPAIRLFGKLTGAKSPIECSQWQRNSERAFVPEYAGAFVPSGLAALDADQLVWTREPYI